MPALTPDAILGLSWRYAWSLIDVRREEAEEQTEAAGGSGGRQKPAEPMPAAGGGFHAPGFSSLFRMIQ